MAVLPGDVGGVDVGVDVGAGIAVVAAAAAGGGGSGVVGGGVGVGVGVAVAAVARRSSGGVGFAVDWRFSSWRSGRSGLACEEWLQEHK